MSLIQRQTLVYQAGSSDKVYEVDLCEVATAKYVVNYRYGKRGGTLKEGSQTPTALALPAAQAAFDKLVASKVAKGYRDTAAPIPVIAPKPVVPTFTADRAGRNQHIIDRLTVAIANPNQPTPPKQWPLDRVIWRAGELQLAAATPLLMQLWGNNPIRNYSIAWAMGNCGNAQAVTLLTNAYRDQSNAEHLRQICLAAIYKLSPIKRAEFSIELLAQLPPQIKSAIEQNLAIEQLLDVVQKYLNKAKPEQFSLISLLYQIDHESCQQFIQAFLPITPFRPNYFKQIRQIFKIAEYRHDAAVLGILTHRLDWESPFYSSKAYSIYLLENRPGRPKNLRLRDWQRDPATGHYQSVVTDQLRNEITNIDSRLAYSNATRDYLRRRVWRTLRKLGESDRSEYVEIAAGILLQYRDEQDQSPPREAVRQRYDYRAGRYHEVSRINWDAYAKYLTFNHILYTNSPRYELKSGKDTWQCRTGFKPGDAIPPVREEAFPQLWTAQPQVLLKLLCESDCQAVHEFATKAIGDCPEFCQALPIATLLQLLAKPYAVTAQLGFELALARYQPSNPQADLVLAIANCAYAPARATAHQWISQQIDHFILDEVLICNLVLSPQTDTQALMRQILGATVMTADRAQTLVARVIAGLLALPIDDLYIVYNAVPILRGCFQVQLRSISLPVILDLLRHPLVILQATGAQILLDQQIPVTDLPAGLIDALIASPDEEVRSIGVQLFGQLPDAILLDRLELILGFVTHPLPEMRQAIVPCVKRLAVYPDFVATLIERLIPILLAPEPVENLHSFIGKLLNDLPNWMTVANQATAWMLLGASATAAQDLGGQLLQVNADRWLTTISTERVAELTQHEVVAVRRAGWEMLAKMLPRLRQNPADLLTATMVMASKWEDARQAGFRLFGELLQPAELSPAVVISICDSNRADVRRFGRDLVGKCFQAQDGLEYLLKFSEHPTADMQLFASQYLEDYAIDNPQRLAELTPYFERVLGQVNRSRVTKERIFNFLSAEANKNVMAAKLVVEVLIRQSASIAVGEKARSIETLLKIHQRYPELAVPIKVQAVALKS
jgi:predicted DNA-binding WGR domain protein